MLRNIFIAVEEAFKEGYSGWDGAEQFAGSGVRLERLVKEMCWPRSHIELEVERCLKAVFKDPFDEMLVTRPINVWTFCPHHILPCNFKVHIGYIPKGFVLGLSKFARVAIALGKCPIMQEQYSRELSDTLWKYLKPEGLGVYVVGRHGCIGCRGVGQVLDISTAVLKGSFKTDSDVRREFYWHITQGGIKD
jgi:GTP cyclohydrolase I